MATPDLRFGLFAVEFASEEDGGQLEHHELIAIFDDKAVAEDHAEPCQGLTSRITFYVRPVEVVGREIRKVVA